MTINRHISNERLKKSDLISCDLKISSCTFGGLFLQLLRNILSFFSRTCASSWIIGVLNNQPAFIPTSEKLTYRSQWEPPCVPRSRVGWRQQPCMCPADSWWHQSWSVCTIPRSSSSWRGSWKWLVCHCWNQMKTFIHWSMQDGVTILQCIFQTHLVGDILSTSCSMKLWRGECNGRMPALVQVMAWHWLGNKPLPKPMMTKFFDDIWRN